MRSVILLATALLLSGCAIEKVNNGKVLTQQRPQYQVRQCFNYLENGCYQNYKTCRNRRDRRCLTKYDTCVYNAHVTCVF